MTVGELFALIGRGIGHIGLAFERTFYFLRHGPWSDLVLSDLAIIAPFVALAWLAAGGFWQGLKDRETRRLRQASPIAQERKKREARRVLEEEQERMRPPSGE